MTITAIDKSTGRRVCALDYEDIRSELDLARDWICPITNHPVTPVRQHLRKGKRVTQHFRCKGEFLFPEDVILDEEYFRLGKNGSVIAGESIEHREGKAFVKSVINEIDNYCKPELGEFEKRVYLPHRRKYRVIDVAFELPSGVILAHEVQLASITPEQLSARTNDYWECGISVQWWFGKSANTAVNRRWHTDHIGESSLILTFSEAGHAE